MIRLVIPRVTPSLNAFARAHWRVIHALRRDWSQEVWVAKLAQRIFADPRHEKVRVLIERCSHRLIRDEDNLIGGCKPVMDALVENGLILDDNRDVVLDMAVRQVKVRRLEACTIITIEPLGASDGA